MTHRDLKLPSATAGGDGGPKQDQRPPWMPAIEGSIGLMFKTCEELESPFLEYLGPLLPEQYWESPSGSLVLDGAVREPKRESNYTEVDVIQWLDSKPRGSVLYVSFGSETGHAIEYPELASALEDSTHPFVYSTWVEIGRAHV